MKKIRKSFWRAYWKLHDKKKMLLSVTVPAISYIPFIDFTQS